MLITDPKNGIALTAKQVSQLNVEFKTKNWEHIIGREGFATKY